MPDTAASPPDGLPQPTLFTERLLLRTLAESDRADIERLAGDPLVSRWTAAIPYPLPRRAAIGWIAEAAAERRRGEAVTYAIERRSDRRFLGGIALCIDATARTGTVGYWLGQTYWNQGYGTEALRCVLDFGFLRLDLHDIVGLSVPENAGSLRVQLKAGMAEDGDEPCELGGVARLAKRARITRQDFLSAVAHG